MAGGGSLAGGSSSVLPINPTEGECCLSFSDEKGASRNLVVNQMLLNPYRATIINDKQVRYHVCLIVFTALKKYRLQLNVVM